MSRSIRLPSGCEHRCKACSHRTLTREESEEQKRAWLVEKLGVAVEAVRSSDSRWGYRDRVCLHAQWGGQGWRLGLRVERNAGREREVLDLPHCPIHSPRVRKAHEKIALGLQRFPGLPMVYVSISGACVTFVLKCASEEADLSPLIALEPALRDAGIESGFVNFNPAAGFRVFSAKGFKKIWGESRIEANGLWSGPSSFHQLLPDLHRSALGEAGTFLSPLPADSVIDLYCGNGSSLSIWRAAGARYIGIELGGEAVECATLSFGPGSVLRGRVSERLPQLEDWIARAEGRQGSQSRKLLYANPPRSGFEPAALQWVAKTMLPEKIAILSCSAGTLARDLSVLCNSGYALRKIIPYDFFPQTHHIEALALLERVS